jgi:deferrochelatase/peroxidase EfeB
MSTRKTAVQEGIYYRSGARPPGFFSFVAIERRSDDSQKVADLLARLWAMYANLKLGTVRDLPGVIVPAGNLQVLLGFGAEAFGESRGHVQNALAAYGFTRPQTVAPGALEPGTPIIATTDDVNNPLPAGIEYSTDARMFVDLGKAAFAVQFTAETALAVERAVVETWKLLADERKRLEDGEEPPLAVTGVFTGCQRDDGRSWLDFHDGVSNLDSSEREDVIVIRSTAERALDDDSSDVMTDGTYLAFIRLTINLERWRELTAVKQEALVGRDKLEGCPFVSIDPETGIGTAIDGCPPTEKKMTAVTDFRDPPALAGADARAALTHIRRAHQRQEGMPSSEPRSHRIFRQGYPFLAPDPGAPDGFRVGLNFVSFQNTPQRLHGLLTQNSWLGGTNFGGPPFRALSDDEQQRERERGLLLEAQAAGFFFVPALAAGEAFPGERILRRRERGPG